MENEAEYKKAGRPTIKVDWEKVDTFLIIACTGEEIAAALSISYDTLARRCKEEHGIDFAEYIKNGINRNFKPSLRRIQRKAAFGIENTEDGTWKEKPSIPMLIWLGKQYLDQKDRNDITSGDRPMQRVVVKVDMEDIEKNN